MTIEEKLLQIQNLLFVPKGNYNDFGKYSYRSCEDILKAVKPLCEEAKTVLYMDTLIEPIGDRIYVRARVTLKDLESKDTITVDGYAREEETKKGMDGSQITGTATSYARKYALAGLFGIDNEKDSDATNDTPKNAENEATSARKKYLQYIGTHSEIDRGAIADLFKVATWDALSEKQAQWYLDNYVKENK